MENKQLTCV